MAIYISCAVFTSLPRLNQRQTCSRVRALPTKQEGRHGACSDVHDRRVVLGLGAATAGLFAGISLTGPAEASAISDFWHSRQTQNDGAKILAPIRASRIKLEAAMDVLMDGSSAMPDYKRVLGMVRPASFNCYIYETSDAESFESQVSLLQQRMGGAVEVCTFKILLKNVVLYSKDEALVDAATQACDRLIDSFSRLDNMLEGASQMEEVSAADVKQGLQETIAATNTFEIAMQKCLGVA